MLPSLLPTLRPNSALDACYRQYLTALKALAFAGDIHDAYGHRLNFATDNSIYQLMPQAVLAPRTQADLQMALQLANEPQYQTITFSPRGGGTGTNGQALNRGIIIDLSRY
ncbi:MAG: FAD-binding protein, partial [Ferrimonas sp.]